VHLVFIFSWLIFQFGCVDFESLRNASARFSAPPEARLPPSTSSPETITARR